MTKQAKKTDAEKDLLRTTRDICANSIRTGDHEPVRKIASLLDDMQRVITEAKKEIEQAALQKPARKPPVKTSRTQIARRAQP